MIKLALFVSILSFGSFIAYYTLASPAPPPISKEELLESLDEKNQSPGSLNFAFTQITAHKETPHLQSSQTPVSTSLTPQEIMLTDLARLPPDRALAEAEEELKKIDPYDSFTRIQLLQTLKNMGVPQEELKRLLHDEIRREPTRRSHQDWVVVTRDLQYFISIYSTVDPDGSPLEDELVDLIDQLKDPNLRNLISISYYSAFPEQKDSLYKKLVNKSSPVKSE